MHRDLLEASEIPAQPVSRAEFNSYWNIEFTSVTALQQGQYNINVISLISPHTQYSQSQYKADEKLKETLNVQPQ